MLDDLSLGNSYIFAVAFVMMWVAISFLMSYIGGWATLAGIYGNQARAFDGQTFRFRSGYMRGLAHYGNVLTIGADVRGLYLAVLFLFRAGHPQLFIPWEDIEISNENGILVSYVTFKFLRASSITLRVSRRLGVQVLEAGGLSRN